MIPTAGSERRPGADDPAADAVALTFREERAAVLATLIRHVGDFQLAEILALSIRAIRLADKYRRAATETETSQDVSSQEGLGAESRFDPTASLPAQARAPHTAMSLIAPS